MFFRGLRGLDRFNSNERMSELANVLIAVPFAIFFFGIIVGFVRGFDCLWEASKQTKIREKDMPFMLRHSRTNILWYPRLLNKNGLRIWRKAVRWYGLSIA